MRKVIIIAITAILAVVTGVFAMGVSASQDVPGVTTEIKEDGTKVVTINLSEIDESKLPEQYEAEVILEAPMMMGEQLPPVKKNGQKVYYEAYKGQNASRTKNRNYKIIGKNITESGIFLTMPEGGVAGNFDTKIDSEGNIYILDMYNRRIQKFNNKGTHVGNILLSNVYEEQGEFGKNWREKIHFKNKIAAGGGKVYVMDTAQGVIEELNEEGKVIERIKVPKEASGKWWADEKGMGIGDVVLKGERGEGRIQVTNNVIKLKKINTDIKLKTSIISIYSIGKDEKRNIYFDISAGEKKERGILKLSESGRIKTFISDSPYWWSDKWKSGCKKIQPFFNGDYIDSTLFSRAGAVYLIQSLCCAEDEDCVSKIRIIALKKQ